MNKGISTANHCFVVPIDESTHTVVEGNRRLAALKLLQNPGLTDFRRTSISQLVEDAQHIPNEVPCIVYDTRDEILDYLGFRHVTGIKSWGPLSKARYLARTEQQ